MQKIPQNFILLTTDVLGLYPNIPHNASLKPLKDETDCSQIRKMHTDVLVNMAEFVFHNDFFDFQEKVFRKISGTAIGKKYTLSYGCIFMDKFEKKFPKTQKLQLFWFRYMDDVLWTHGNEELQSFIKRLNSFSNNLKFKYEFKEEIINFLDVNIDLSKGRLMTNTCLNLQSVISI